MPKNTLNNLILGLTFILVIAGIAVGGMAVGTADISATGRHKVRIAPDSSLSAIAHQLRQEGVISSVASFKFLGVITGVGRRVQAGTYLISPSETTWGILRRIARGDVMADTFSLTIPEGMSVFRIRKLLEENDIDTSPWEIDRPLLKKFSFLVNSPDGSLEGYLFPDTYEISRSAPSREFLEKMLSNFERQALPYLREGAKSKNTVLGRRLTPHQILTLASIIEKEAAVAAERPTIASVYLNRLKIGMALQADPTVKYVLEDPRPKVSLEDLTVSSPYNTYRHRGLPPGPICNPGISSIQAVLNPSQTDYFYFVANGDGSHTFTRTFEEHQKAKNGR